MNGQPATLWSQQLTPDGTALVPGTPSALLTPSQAWQGGVVEGPSMISSGGQDVLFYSANDWKTTNYAIGFADCTGPLGPCTEGVPPAPTGHPTPTSVVRGDPACSPMPRGPCGWPSMHGCPAKSGFPHSRVLFLRPVTITGGIPQIGS